MGIWNYKDTTFNERFIKLKNCPFCEGQLTHLFTNWHQGNHCNENHDYTEVQVCQICGWWKINRHKGTWGPKATGGGPFDGLSKYHMSETGLLASLKNLDLTDLSLPLEDVKSYLCAKYEKRFSIHPRLFEETVGSVFSNIGYDVSVTNYSGDGGIDVILRANGEEIGVQVKRHQNKITVSQIRELIGALCYEGIPRGIFVTTSEFQSGAYKIQNEIESRNRSVKFVDLYDGKRFYDVLKISQRDIYKSEKDFWEGKTFNIDSMPTIASGHGY